MNHFLKFGFVALLFVWMLHFSANAQSDCDSAGYSACLNECAAVMPSCAQQCKSYPENTPEYLDCMINCNEALGDCQRGCEAEYPGYPTICTYPYGAGDGCGS
jgi:hypothetical protein